MMEEERQKEKPKKKQKQEIVAAPPWRGPTSHADMFTRISGLSIISYGPSTQLMQS